MMTARGGLFAVGVSVWLAAGALGCGSSTAEDADAGQRFDGSVWPGDGPQPGDGGQPADGPRSADQGLLFSDAAAPDGACIPDCAGKVCGDNGCGDLCGPCDDGVCQDGACVAAPSEGSTAAEWGAASGDGTWTAGSGGAFGYKQISGAAVQITARVLAVEDDPACQAGLMVRGALEDGAQYGAMTLTPQAQVELSWRAQASAADAARHAGPVGKPYWLRLKRVRDHVRAFYSADGRNWLMHGYGPEVELPPSIYIGLSTSGRQQKACVAAFDNVSITTPTIPALDKEIAPLPPMGWNSWNHIGPALDAEIVSEMMDTFVSRGLRDAGYTFVNLDDFWQKHRWSGRDENPLTYDEQRFPQGIAPLADRAHSLGLKLGIYSGPGNTTCADFPGSLGHETEDAQTWASWGVDYLKYDSGCIVPRTRRQSIGFYRTMRDALAASGREIIHSVVNAGVNDDWEWAGAHGQLWRTNMDIYNSWTLNGNENGCGSWGEWSILTILDNVLPLWRHHGFGNYNDLDMLVLALGDGASDVDVNIKSCDGGMNRAEFRSHFTLWSILGSPLLHGSDLRAVGQWAIDVMTDREVIALNQDPLTLQAQLVHESGDVQVIAKALADGSRGVAVLNRGSQPKSIAVRWRDIGLPPGSATVRDLWAKTDHGAVTDVFQVVDLASHATAALRIAEATPPAGIAFEAEAALLQGGLAAKRCVTCYGGGFAEGSDGSLSFEHVYARATTSASITVYYLDPGQARRFDLHVNGGAAQSTTLPTAAGGRTMARHTLKVGLQAGDNTLRLAAGANLAIDRIVVDAAP